MFVIFAQTPAAGGRGPTAPPPQASLLAPLGPKLKVAPAPDYELRRAPNGDLVYDAPGFTARVARDGSVSFHDKHVTLSFLPLLLQPRSRPRAPISSVPSLEAVIRGRGQPPPPPPDLVEDSSVAYGSRLPIPTVTPYRPDPREACR